MRLTHVSLLGTIVGAVFWGLSGTAAQALFQDFHFPVLGLLSIRMMVAGSILLLIVRPKLPESSSKSLRQLAMISIFALLGSQLTYLAAINFSNAATATLLQFLFLPMIACYEAATGSIRWSLRWTVTLVLAALGTVLLIGIFSGSRLALLITPAGLLFGLLSAVAAAYNAIASRPIVRSKGAWWLTSWGFIIGGLVSLPFGAYSLLTYAEPSSFFPLQIEMIGLILFVVVFGTLLAYNLYLSGLKRLSATEVGVATSIEPIASASAAYLFLGVILTTLQYIGAALLLVAVAVIAFQEKQKENITIVPEGTGIQEEEEKKPRNAP